jgi:TonB family protein
MPAAESGPATEVLRPTVEQWCAEGVTPGPNDDCIVPPVLLHAVSPAYPELALKARIIGKVELEAVVTALGDVGEVRVLKPNPAFTEAAVTAVKQRRYRPAVRRGQPVAICFPITVRFDLTPQDYRRPAGPTSAMAEVISVSPADPKGASTGVTPEERPIPKEKQRGPG